MSTLNTNLDNDPFPVFTPRSTLQQQQQQQLGRSPAQMPPPPSVLQSPFRLSSHQHQQQQQQQQNMLGLMRSPSNAIQSRQAQNLSNDMVNRQMLANMVQNLSLNPSNSGLPTQSPLINKLVTPSTTPPPTSSSLSSLAQSSQASNAHRKLFSSIENTGSHHQLTDMVMLNDNFNPQLGSQMPTLVPAQQSVPTLPTHNLIQSHQFHQELEPSRMAPPDLACVAHLKRSDSYFMSDELRSELLRKNILLLAVSAQEPAIPLPSQLKEYHNLVPLDNQQINIDHKSRTFAYQTISYKATHIKTNCVYYLKRICGFRYVNQRCIEIVEMWKKIQHANMCSLRDVFGTKEFGDHSIIFVYDFYPSLETLQYRLFNNPNINLKGWSNPYNIDGQARPFSAGKTINGSRSLGLLPEQNVWEYVIQLSSILRIIHSANLACRILKPQRILVDHKSRLRLSGIGIFDVIDFENSVNNLAQHQQEDLVDFGRLVLALACNSLIAIQKEHLNTSLDIIAKSYSADLRNLISHFMTAPANINGRLKSINDAMPIIGSRFYTVLDNAYTRADIIENDLAKEIENGRLFRLICKLNVVLERQDMLADLQWGETGDRYMLKLFRDYVFHQVGPNGQPYVDLSHIIQCLNKFDTGSNDKICLVSPDSQNVMIVSFAQLKKCFDKVFNEVLAYMNQ